MTFDPIPITGNIAFDYMFSLVFVSGLVSVAPYLLFKLLRS